MTRVDAHLHVWRAAGAETPGVATIVPPQEDVPLESALDTLTQHGVDRAVLVQPVFRGEDNSYVAECARSDSARLAAVCVVDPRVPGAEQRLEHWVGQGCRGLRLRPRIAAEAEIFGDPATFPLWEAARRLHVVVSVLADTRHAAAIGALAERFGDVSIVIDHLAHPDPVAGVRDPGFQQLLGLARHPRVLVKMSGCYHFSREPFPFADCHELIRAVYEHFGPERLVWGSDFPHVLRRSGYASALELPEMALGAWPTEEREMVMGGNAMKLYWPEA
jgi:predicted TIM-barrel fold metal-dependent hydrolase